MNTAESNVVRCIDHTKRTTWECNVRLELVEIWLKENVGRRWSEWNHSDKYGYGYVEIKDPELALVFKLRFGC